MSIISTAPSAAAVVIAPRLNARFENPRCENGMV